MYQPTIIHFHNQSQSGSLIKELHMRLPIHQFSRGITMEQCITSPKPRHRPGFVASLLRMFAVARQRRKLLHLSDRLLDDMGIDRETALYEAQRPIWDVPKGWRRN
jgi:uncharacterized protein YjiS (DUF1127 family)